MAEWRLTHRLPPAAIDYWTECGEEGLAEAARWVVETPDRPVFMMTDGWAAGSMSGPFPCGVHPYFYWFPSDTDEHANCVPVWVGREMHRLFGRKWYVPLDRCLADFLEGFAAGFSPIRSEAHV